MLQSAVSKYQTKALTSTRQKKDRAVSNRVRSVVKADRDEEIFRLRIKGMSTDMIAAQVGESAGFVNRVIREEIKRINEHCMESAQEVQSMELQRLDKLMLVHMELAEEGDIESTSMVLRLMDQRAKYLGIYSANKLEVKGEVFKQYIGIDMSKM